MCIIASLHRVTFQGNVAKVYVPVIKHLVLKMYPHKAIGYGYKKINTIVSPVWSTLLASYDKSVGEKIFYFW